MVGMRDVAKKAGVSLSTVSLVANGTGYVSDAMRARVTDAMRSLDYIPNELARNLYRNRTNIIGIIVPTVRHPFFSSFVSALQRSFAARGMHAMLCSTSGAEKTEKEYIDMVQRRMMDGIVMAAHTQWQEDFWVSIGRPVVSLDRYLGLGIPSVCSNHEQGGRLIAEHLIATGARHVVSVGGPRSQFEDLPAGIENRTTFPSVRYHMMLERMMGEQGIPCDYVEAGEVSSLGDHAQAAHEVFERFPDVDAVVGSDLVAAYCVQEARHRGLRVPEDLQVIAYDGTFMADAAGLRLTCVRQDMDGLAERVVIRMMQLIEETPVDDELDVVPVRFVPGDTTR
ncbi:LacI family DNA-binding transcriptional regulator [Bifidobacterium eulemuris]|uniref:LacI family DNA-binding transcriptional regulator n=1 Tax=Bifidobacterium eulemuris TaxID=1765219 RepID=A0A261GE28_9BIFI|nr:LacI family DNA-binding transcriptional regulator [Bifidobacterium eulemuris]OZG69692.1 LacI family transcriptional regulator [Bifidobacterium eulemuris]QOL32204.1 LacI family DNA-binding transcriptional regulator [Bifidobacterium eulemuris]